MNPVGMENLTPSDFDTSDNVPATLSEPMTPGRMLRALRELAELRACGDIN